MAFITPKGSIILLIAPSGFQGDLYVRAQQRSDQAAPVGVKYTVHRRLLDLLGLDAETVLLQLTGGPFGLWHHAPASLTLGVTTPAMQT